MMAKDKKTREKTKEEEADEREARLYELGYHVLPTVAEDELGAHISRIKDTIESHEGVIAGEEMPKKIELAYPIAFVPAKKRGAETKKKYQSAYFGWMKFRVQPGKAEVLEKELRMNEMILRFILVKASQEKVSTPRAMTFMKQESKRPKKPSTPASKKDDTINIKRKDVSEEELDKQIEELIVE